LKSAEETDEEDTTNIGYDSSDEELMKNFIPDSGSKSMDSLLEQSKNIFNNESTLLALGSNSSMKLTKA